MSLNILGRPARVSVHVLLLIVLLGTCTNARAAEAEKSAPAEPSRDSSSKVVIHMTGLLLLVRHSLAMDVVMPGMAHHEARFGFGIPPSMSIEDRQLLCNDDGFPGKPSDRGYCYVDLEDWEMEPLGDATMPRPMVDALPEGVLDITEHWQYQARIPPYPGTARSRLRFLTGGPGESCSLAKWKIRPYAHAGGPHPVKPLELVNVLEWLMDGVASQLVFKQKPAGRRIVVSLEGPEVHLVLAHVHEDDLPQLPPYGGRPDPGPLDRARDFEGFYEVLQRHVPLPDGHPRIPFSGKKIEPRRSAAISRGCSMGMTRIAGQPPVFKMAPGTYSCMIATAERL
jgi:hypothetical protein